MSRRVRVFAGIILLLVALGAGLAVLAVLAAPRTDALQVVTVGQDPFGIAIDSRAGHVFVVNTTQGNGPSTVSVLGAADGSPRRTTPVGVWAHGIVVGDRRGRAFISNTADARSHAPNSVSVIDTRTGREQQRVPLSASLATMTVDRTVGHVFLGLYNGRVQALDAANGRLIGAIALGFTPLASAVDERRGRALFVGSGRAGVGYLAVLDTHSSRLLWKAIVGLAPSAVAVDTRQGHVFVGSVGPGPGACAASGGNCPFGSVSMLDVRDGRVLRTVNVEQNPASIVTDERTQRVFVVSAGANQSDIGTVSVLDARTGAVLRTTTVGYGSAGAAVDVRRAHVYVANGNSGTVSVLDARTGRALGAFRVVAGPVAVAVDERTDRVFVSSDDVSGGIAQTHQVGGRSVMDQISFFEAEASNELRLLHKGRTGTVSVFDAQKTP